MLLEMQSKEHCSLSSSFWCFTGIIINSEHLILQVVFFWSFANSQIEWVLVGYCCLLFFISVIDHYRQTISLGWRESIRRIRQDHKVDFLMKSDKVRYLNGICSDRFHLFWLNYTSTDNIFDDFTLDFCIIDPLIQPIPLDQNLWQSAPQRWGLSLSLSSLSYRLLHSSTINSSYYSSNSDHCTSL